MILHSLFFWCCNKLGHREDVCRLGNKLAGKPKAKKTAAPAGDGVLKGKRVKIGQSIHTVDDMIDITVVELSEVCTMTEAAMAIHKVPKYLFFKSSFKLRAYRLRVGGPSTFGDGKTLPMDLIGTVWNCGNGLKCSYVC